MGTSPWWLRALDLQTLHGFRQHQTTIHTLSGAETNLTGRSIEFVEALEGSTLAIGNPVRREVTEQDRLGAGSDFGHVGRGNQTVVEQLVRLTFLEAGLPEVLTVAVLQLSDGLDGAVVQQEDGLLAID